MPGLFASMPPLSGRSPLPERRDAHDSAAGEWPQTWTLDRLALIHATSPKPRIEVVR